MRGSFLWPIWVSSKIGIILSVPTLTSKISCSRIFVKNLIIQVERVHPRESRKNIICPKLSCWRLEFFFQFFSPFFKIDIFWFFCILPFFLMYFMTLILIFSKLGMYLTYCKSLFFSAHLILAIWGSLAKIRYAIIGTALKLSARYN